MDLLQVMRRDLVRMTCSRELQQTGFRSIGNAPMQFVVQRMVCAAWMARIVDRVSRIGWNDGPGLARQMRNR